MNVNNPKILLFGKDGQLGKALNRLLPQKYTLSVGRKEANFLDPFSIKNIIGEYKPKIIINAAAYTNVNKAEIEYEVAKKINGYVPGIIAEEGKKIGSTLIHISTDYVFDGMGKVPYIETDQTNPINIYGKSKLLGEKNIVQVGGNYFIFRTSWVYNLENDNFVTRVLRWGKSNNRLRIVTDQIGTPTFSTHLSDSIIYFIRLLKTIDSDDNLRGIYHLAGKGFVSRFNFAKQILKLAPYDTSKKIREMEKAVTTDFITKANRPLFSALNCNKFEQAFGIQMPSWEESLREAMKRN